jgi:hypothetical protein
MFWLYVFALLALFLHSGSLRRLRAEAQASGPVPREQPASRPSGSLVRVYWDDYLGTVDAPDRLRMKRPGRRRTRAAENRVR